MEKFSITDFEIIIFISFLLDTDNKWIIIKNWQLFKPKKEVNSTRDRKARTAKQHIDNRQGFVLRRHFCTR
ncbi:MAG: hypothetical protein H7096_11900 [Flavobacterium sp.]|nr:hypothetical protein [Pedobacter sp.]